MARLECYINLFIIRLLNIIHHIVCVKFIRFCDQFLIESSFQLLAFLSIVRCECTYAALSNRWCSHSTVATQTSFRFQNTCILIVKDAKNITLELIENRTIFLKLFFQYSLYFRVLIQI